MENLHEVLKHLLDRHRDIPAVHNILYVAHWYRDARARRTARSFLRVLSVELHDRSSDSHALVPYCNKRVSDVEMNICISLKSSSSTDDDVSIIKVIQVFFSKPDI